MKLKSTAKRTKQLDYNTKFVIKQLKANPNIIKQQEEQMRRLNPKADPQLINRQIMNIVIRDNVFNEIMNNLVTYYDFNLDKDELSSYAKRYGEIYKDASAEVASKIAENMVKKSLVYSDLATLWDVRTSDDETKQFLQNYYKQTNNPIRDILNNKDQFENFKQMIQDEKITNQIVSRFKNVQFDLPKKPADAPNAPTGKEEPKK